MWVDTCNASQPWLCEEDRSYENASLFKEGSTPTMRGTLFRACEYPYAMRLNPDYVGNTIQL